jgi:hypothetical protein
VRGQRLQRDLRTPPPDWPDWLQTDCKAHPRYTSWLTSVGSTSPEVVKDPRGFSIDTHRKRTVCLFGESTFLSLHVEGGSGD